METFDVSSHPKKNVYFFTYILFSLKDKGLYIGFCGDLQQRMSQHREGRVVSTKNRRPLTLIFSEAFISKKDALAREEFLKSGFGRKQLYKSLKNTLSSLTAVSSVEGD